MMKFYKYSGAGNTFTIIDGRRLDVRRFKNPRVIHALCLQYETDGLMILEDPLQGTDFRMTYFNSDGTGGMMCGNGGRCIVAFADLVGVKPFHSTDYVFEAPDGIHKAKILSHLGECKIVSLQMSDVSEVREMRLDDGTEGYFINTGARHFVTFVDDADTVDVGSEGRRLRRDEHFAPEGTNVDFVSMISDGRFRVRTFEKGVEAETQACGTGITASAIAACLKGGRASSAAFSVQANEDELTVEFTPSNNSFTDVCLTGPTLCLGDLVE